MLAASFCVGWGAVVARAEIVATIAFVNVLVLAWGRLRICSHRTRLSLRLKVQHVVMREHEVAPLPWFGQVRPLFRQPALFEPWQKQGVCDRC